MNTITRIGNTGFNYIEFSWHLTNWCNYQCDYCPVLDVLTKDFTKPSHTSAKMTVARLKTVQTLFRMCISGGEPTLHPEFFDIIQALDDMPNCNQIAVMTNFSRSVEFYEKISNLKSEKIVIMAAYHPQYYKDKFFEKALHMSKILKRFRIQVNLSDDPSTWDHTIQLINNFELAGIKIRPNILLPNQRWKPNYTQEFKDKFYKYMEDSDQLETISVEFEDGTKTQMKAYEIHERQLDKFKGYSCIPMYFNIDIEGTIINLCTKKKMPMGLSSIVREELCPNDICGGKQFLEFPKKKV